MLLSLHLCLKVSLALSHQLIQLGLLCVGTHILWSLLRLASLLSPCLG
jgi:hypothetical protein